MNYEKIYDNLTNRAINRQLSEYTEEHHIIPLCIGGSDTKDNLINLTPEEHYLAHLLLVKIYPNQPLLVYAANMMCVDKTGNRVNNKRYGWLKRKLSKLMSDKMKGRTKHNDEIIRLAAIKRSGENHPLFGKTKDNNDIVANLAKINANRTKENDEGRRQQSIKISGDNHYFKNKTKEDCSSLKVISEKKKGKNKNNNLGRKITSEKLTKLNNEHQQTVLQMKQLGYNYHEIMTYFLLYGISVSIVTLRRIVRKLTNSNKKRGGITKLSDEQINEIVQRKDNGEKFYHIYKSFKEERNIDITAATIRNTYNRIKNEQV